MQPYAKKVRPHLQHSCQHRSTADLALCRFSASACASPSPGRPWVCHRALRRNVLPRPQPAQADPHGRVPQAREGKLASLFSQARLPRETLLESQRCFPVRSELRTDVARPDSAFLALRSPFASSPSTLARSRRLSSSRPTRPCSRTSPWDERPPPTSFSRSETRRKRSSANGSTSSESCRVSP